MHKGFEQDARGARRPAYAAQAFAASQRPRLCAQLINPSETFGDIVIDYSYVECTSACMTALRVFADAHPGHRSREIGRAMERGRRFVLKVCLTRQVTRNAGRRQALYC